MIAHHFLSSFIENFDGWLLTSYDSDSFIYELSNKSRSKKLYHWIYQQTWGVGFSKKTSFATDDMKVPGMGPPSLPTDPDPICQFLSNCPLRNDGNGSGSGGSGKKKSLIPPEPTVDPAMKPSPDDEFMVDASQLNPCDAFGRLENGGRFPHMGEHCDDPLHRGHGICISVLPSDFSARTGGFCYSDSLNHAAGSAWFFDKNQRWSKPARMITPRKFPDTLNHRVIKADHFNKADMWEVKDTKGRWWPCTLLDIKPDTGTIEALVYDKNKNPLFMQAIDGINLRSYSAQEFGINDKVLLESQALKGATGGIASPGTVGTIIGGGSGSWLVRSDAGIDGTYSENQLIHAGLDYNQIPKKMYITVGQEYDYKLQWANLKEDVQHVTVQQILPGDVYKIAIYNPKNEKWSYPPQPVPRTSLRIIAGVDTGRCLDMCKVHTGQGFCVSSLALQRYLNSDGIQTYLGNSKAALEIDCKATKDRRSITAEGGSNCNRYLRTQQPHQFFRVGKDETWKTDGEINFVKKQDKGSLALTIADNKIPKY